MLMMDSQLCGRNENCNELQSSDVVWIPAFAGMTGFNGMTYI